MIASYLVMVEDRDIKREQQEAEARRKRQEEFLARQVDRSVFACQPHERMQEAERAIREQELAAMRSREQQEASRLEVSSSSPTLCHSHFSLPLPSSSFPFRCYLIAQPTPLAFPSSWSSSSSVTLLHPHHLALLHSFSHSPCCHSPHRTQ